jgi:guanylate kinase
MILSLTGPSGVGKTTLMHNLLKALPNAQPLTSYTTRVARPSDEPGEYHYITQAEFDRMSAAGEFLWEAHAYVNHYGTRKADIDTALESGILYMPVLVLSAVKKLHEYANEIGKTPNLHSMYIRIEDEAELRARFAERGDKPEEAEARIVECRTWNEEAKNLGVPFIYLEAQKKREDILADALEHLKTIGLTYN